MGYTHRGKPSLLDASDLKMKSSIPNWFVWAVFLPFYPVAIVIGLPISVIVANTLVSLLLLVVFVFLVARGYLGGGAAKLICALSIWLGGTFNLYIFLVVTAFLVSLPFLISRIFNRSRAKASGAMVPVLPGAIVSFIYAFIGSETYIYAAGYLKDNNILVL